MNWTLRQFAIILAAALTLWLWPSIFGGKVLLPLDIMAHVPPFSPESTGPIHNRLIGDMLVENFAWKTFQRECLMNGELPLWTPYSFCGHPIYTTGQTSTFYPPNLIFMIVPIPYAYVLFTWLHLFMGGIFAWLFFRRVGVSGFGASVGAVIFAMSTYMAVRFIWPMLLGSAIWLPLMLLWIDWMTEPRTGRKLLAGIPAGAVLFAMPLLSGFFEIAFYVFTAAGLYTLVLGIAMIYRERKVRPPVVFFAKVGGVTALAAALSAPQLLPFFEVMNRNVRAGSMTYEAATKSGLKFSEAITFISPDVLGDPSDHYRLDLATRDWQPIKAKNGQDSYYFGPKNYVESTNYLGLLPVAFAALSVLAPGRRRAYFWILLALSLGLAFATPLYWLFFHLVPGGEQVRTPFRWTLLTMFACTYLAAIGADDWYARLAAPTQRLTQVAAVAKFIGAILFAVAVAALFFYPAGLGTLAERIMAADPRAASTFEDPMALAGLIWLNLARFALFGLAAILIVALAYWRAWGPKSITAFSLAAVALVAVDLGQATYDFNTHADPKILDRVPPIVEHLQEESQKDVFRMGRYGWQATFPPNLPTLFGIQDFGGYDSIILTDYARYMEAIEPLKQLRYNIVSTFEQKASLDSPLFRLLNIRYLISVKALDHPDYEPVDVPGNLKLSRIKPEREIPRAFLVGRVQSVAGLPEAIDAIKSGQVDITQAATVHGSATRTTALVEAAPGPSGQARITSYRPSRVRIETSAPARQLLVLCDVHYPGWQAYVDGQSADIIPTNGIFRGVSVPAGSHAVEFRFEPATLRTGAILSIACLLGLAAIQTLLWLPRRGTESRTPEKT